jgi:6-phosphogluconolactonase (cycloisomerase 2 family)
MLQTHLVVRTLSALGLAALFAACSSSGSSGTITPSGVAPGSAGTEPFGAIGQFRKKLPGKITVANYGSNNVSVYTVDAKTGALTQVAGSPFGAGTEPFGVAMMCVPSDPKCPNTFAYVTNYGSGNVSAYTVDAKTGALTQVAGSPFGAGTNPVGVAIIERGKDAIFAYVTNLGSGNVSAYAVNAKTGALRAVRGSPFGAGSGPTSLTGVENSGNTYLYVTNTGSSNVSAYTVNAKSGALKQVAGSPFGAGTEPDGVADVENNGGSYLYVTNSGSGNVSAYTISGSSGALTQVAGSPFGAGTGPFGVADLETSGGTYLYVANDGSDNVSGYTISGSGGGLTQVAGSPFAAGSGPVGVATCSVALGGKKGRDDYFAYVTNGSSNNVSGYSIDASSGALTAVTGSPFGAGTEPYGIADNGVENNGSTYCI